MKDFDSVIANMPCVFSLDVAPSLIPLGHILMNAPRPLLGNKAEVDAFVHGRFFVLLDASDPYSAIYAAENAKLDAYVVLPASRAQITEMVLEGCKYEDSYRAMEESERWDALSGRFGSIQRLPLPEAQAKLSRATAKLEGPTLSIHAILEIDPERRYERRMPDYKLASTLLGHTVAFDPNNPDVAPLPYKNDDEHDTLTPGDVCRIEFELVYSKGGEDLSLGYHPIMGNAERAMGIFASAGHPS
jgi:hypothetical protein